MKYLLPNNRSKFNQNYNSGLSSSIYLPLNIGRYVGPDNTSLFKTKPDNDSVNLAEWITNQITLGNIILPAGDGNGIISTLPTQSVTIDAAGNSLLINDIDVADVSTTTSGYLGLYLDASNREIYLQAQNTDGPVGPVTSDIYIYDQGDYTELEIKSIAPTSSKSSIINMSAGNGIGGTAGIQMMASGSAGNSSVFVNENQAYIARTHNGTGNGLYITDTALEFKGDLPSTWAYSFPLASPSVTNGIISQVTWTGTGAAATPAFQQIASGSYADDGQAGAGGVDIGYIYYNTTGNAFKVRMT